MTPGVATPGVATPGFFDSRSDEANEASRDTMRIVGMSREVIRAAAVAIVAAAALDAAMVTAPAQAGGLLPPIPRRQRWSRWRQLGICCAQAAILRCRINAMELSGGRGRRRGKDEATGTAAHGHWRRTRQS